MSNFDPRTYANGITYTGRQTVIASGQPFTTFAAMDAWSQTHASELLNNPVFVTLATVTADPDTTKIGTYEWAGPDLTYTAGGWVFFTGLDASDIKRLYESNPNTNAFTNPDNATVGSVQALAAGVIPQASSGALTPSGLTRTPGGQMLGASMDMITSDIPMQLPDGGALQVGNWDFSNGGSIIISTELASGRKFYPVGYELTSSGASTAWREKFGPFTTAPSPVAATQVFSGQTLQFSITSTDRGNRNRYTFKVAPNATAATSCNLQVRVTSFTHDPPIFDYMRSTGGVGFDIPANPTGSPVNLQVNLPVPAFFTDGQVLFVTLTAGTGTLSLMGDVLAGQNVPYFEIFGQQSVLTTIADLADIPAAQVQADWTQANNALPSFIQHKPTALSAFTNDSVVGSIQAGTNVTVDTTNPRSPIISATGGGSTLAIRFFTDASSTLTASAVKAALPTANTVNTWDASQLNTLTTDFTSVSGARFVWFAIPSAEQITTLGISSDGGTIFTGLGPAFKFAIDYSGVNFNVYCTTSSFNFPVGPYRIRFTTAQFVGTGGLTYVSTPASQELTIGTGDSRTITKSGLTLVGGKVPSTFVGVNLQAFTGQVDLKTQANWQQYRFQRLQFSGSDGALRGIYTLPDISAGSSWLNVGDWVEVINIGPGNYNCQIATYNVSQGFTGALSSGGNILLGVSTTRVYRFTYTGNATNWNVTQLTVSGLGGPAESNTPPWENPLPSQNYWLPKPIGQGLITPYDVWLTGGPCVVNVPFVDVGNGVIPSSPASAVKWTFNDNVGACVFYRQHSGDQNFPYVVIDQYGLTVDDTAALAYLTGVVAVPGYQGQVQAPGVSYNVLAIRSIAPGITSEVWLDQATSTTNLVVGGYLIIQGAAFSGNNGLFQIEALGVDSGFLKVQYVNPSSDPAIDEGDGTTAICQTGVQLFWTTVADQVTSSSVAIGMQYYIDSGRTTLYSGINTSAINTWLSYTYTTVQAGAGNAYVSGQLQAAQTYLGSKPWAQSAAPATLGDAPYYDPVNGVWAVGAPRVGGLPVPQSTLASPADDWKVLTYFNGLLTMGYPTIKGAPISVDGIIDQDTLEYNAGTGTWYRNTARGSVFAQYSSAGFSVPDSTDTLVIYDTADELYNFNAAATGIAYSPYTYGFYNNTQQRITITVSYLISYETNSAGHRFGWISFNGSGAERLAYSTINACSGDITTVAGSATMTLGVGQYFQVYTWQTSGTTLTANAGGAGGLSAGYGGNIQITRIK